MLDDIMFDAATALSLDVLSSRISAPIYEYLFSYEAPFGMIKTLFQVEDGELWLPCRKKIVFALLQFITLLPSQYCSGSKSNLINSVYVIVARFNIGVSHGDDLTYEFYSDALKNVPQPGSPAEKMMRIFTTLLANFAKDGCVVGQFLIY